MNKVRSFPSEMSGNKSTSVINFTQIEPTLFVRILYRVEYRAILNLIPKQTPGRSVYTRLVKKNPLHFHDLQMPNLECLTKVLQSGSQSTQML